MKKNVGIILLVALFGSLLLNVCQFVGVGHTEKASPWVGTYICGDEWDGATYIVLTADREYYRYQQFGTPEKAAWTPVPSSRTSVMALVSRAAVPLCRTVRPSGSRCSSTFPSRSRTSV